METGGCEVGQMFTNNWTQQGSDAVAGKSLMEKSP